MVVVLELGPRRHRGSCPPSFSGDPHDHLSNPSDHPTPRARSPRRLAACQDTVSPDPSHEATPPALAEADGYIPVVATTQMSLSDSCSSTNSLSRLSVQ